MEKIENGTGFGKTFDLLRFDRKLKENIKVGEIREGEQFHIEGSDGKVHTGSVRIKKVYCGKQCKKCPHPSFAYIRVRDGNTVREKYLGKVE